MLRINVLGRGAFRALNGLLCALALAALTSSPAQADGRYASIVIDVQSGKTLYSKQSDERRYPASLTKIMTLYLVFEDLEAGRLRTNLGLTVSANAAGQAPSKLGLKPGSSIKVEDAIKALVTKSANDVAVVVAENLAGSEEAFARRMTAKARALGMSSTTFRNASGLPDAGQVTTARDLALLGVAIQQHFPAQYRYFSTRTFNFGRRSYGNHNKLLGRLAGVDGIKTGYTNASGFNLVTSVRRDGRQLIAVVLGGATGRSRDAHMQGLVAAYLPKASPTRTTPVLIAKAPREITAKRPVVAALAAPTTVSVPLPAEAPPDADTTEPSSDEEVAVTQGPAQQGPIVLASLAEPASAAPIAAGTPLPLASAPARGPSRSTKALGLEPNREAMQFSVESLAAQPAPMTLDAQVAMLASPSAKTRPSPRPAAAVVEQGDAEEGGASATVGSWIVQIGAVPSEAGAEALLEKARLKARRELAAAAPMTERVGEGDKALYRARFAGFDRAAADAACKALKKSDFACFATQN